jgi:hypothetical protein
MHVESERHSMIAAPVNQSGISPRALIWTTTDTGSADFREPSQRAHQSARDDVGVDSQAQTRAGGPSTMPDPSGADLRPDLRQQSLWTEQLLSDPLLRLKAAAYNGDSPEIRAKHITTSHAITVGLRNPDLIRSVLTQCFSMNAMRQSCTQKQDCITEKLRQDHERQCAEVQKEHKRKCALLRKDARVLLEKYKSKLQRQHKIDEATEIATDSLWEIKDLSK